MQGLGSQDLTRLTAKNQNMKQKQSCNKFNKALRKKKAHAETNRIPEQTLFEELWVLHEPTAVVCVYSLSCVPLFCGPMDCSPAGSSVHGIPQARILEWVAISSPRGSSSFWELNSLPLSHQRSPTAQCESWWINCGPHDQQEGWGRITRTWTENQLGSYTVELTLGSRTGMKRKGPSQTLWK